MCLVAKQDPNTTLIPKDTKSYAEVIQWCSFANHEVLPHLGAWFRPILGRDPYNKKNVEQAEVVIKRILKYLDETLLHRTYLVGERLTIADLVMTAHLDRGFQYVCIPPSPFFSGRDTYNSCLIRNILLRIPMW